MEIIYKVRKKPDYYEIAPFSGRRHLVNSNANCYELSTATFDEERERVHFHNNQASFVVVRLFLQ